MSPDKAVVSSAPSSSGSGDWFPITAVVRHCRASWAYAGDAETGSPEQYVVSYSYEVDGRTYRGWYYAGTFHENGETLEILYDPLHPHLNTGSEFQVRPLWFRIIEWVLSVAVALLVLWLGSRFASGE